METNKVKTPILTTLNRIAALLAFVVAVGIIIIGIKESQPVFATAIGAGTACIYGLFLWGVAEVILLIAKIEFNTRSEDNSYQTVKLLTKIARNTEK